MIRRLMIGAVSAAALTLSTAAFAQQGQFGTAAEAKAMFEKAVAAVKADKAKALDTFNKGEGGFKDRDLYPFCFNISDGKGVATPVAVPAGTDLRTLRGPNGEAFGQETYAAATQKPGPRTLPRAR